jgi:hypothetical protein
MWNRTADNWRPLFAIASAIGGPLPDLLDDAAETLIAQNANDPQTLGIMLLADIRAVFVDSDRLASVELVRSLLALEERPWTAIGKRHPRPLDSRMMGEILQPYGISSKPLRIAGKTTKGFERQQFRDVWHRYLEPLASVE